MTRGRKGADLTGLKFGRLTVLAKRGPTSGPGVYFWLCRCQCGVEKEVSSAPLKSGKTTSCGCFQREKARRLGVKNSHGPFGHGYSQPYDYDRAVTEIVELGEEEL